MNILVTGGAGFIGSHTVIELAQAGYVPIILDNFCNSDISVLNGLTHILGATPRIYTGDCTDTSFLETIFTENNIDGVIHFAALKAVNESIADPLRYYRNNLDSLITVLDVAKKHGTTSIIFSSSATVYGEPDTLPIREDAPRKPAFSPYGATKQICEDILRDTVAASVSLRAISLRYFNPIGAHPSGLIGELPLGTPNNLVPFITQTAAGLRHTLTLFGNDYKTPDGTCIRDYIHVVDLAKAHIVALESLTSRQDTHPYYNVYNIGTGQGTSVKELLTVFETVTGVSVSQAIGSRRSGDIVACYADPSKIQHELDWHAELSLVDALTDAWRWQQYLGTRIHHEDSVIQN